jgi:hypothetical protein
MPPDRIEALQAQTEKTYSRTVWNLILKSVREHPRSDPVPDTRCPRCAGPLGNRPAALSADHRPRRLRLHCMMRPYAKPPGRRQCPSATGR